MCTMIYFRSTNVSLKDCLVKHFQADFLGKMVAHVSIAYVFDKYQQKLALQSLNCPLRHYFREISFRNQGILCKCLQEFE